jgi:hypothetical protein
MENAGQWLAMGQNIVRPEISEGAWLMHGHGADCNAAGRRTDLKKTPLSRSRKARQWRDCS